MNTLETLKLSIKAIIANRMRSFLTILGIVIGVLSVILLISLVSGLKTYITNEVAGLGSNIMFVIPGKIGEGGHGGVTINRLTTSNVKDLRTALKNEAEVSAAVTKAASLKYGNKTDKGVTVLGTQANIDKIIKMIKITEGRFMTISEDNSGTRVAIIGPTVSKNLFSSGSGIGKFITLGNLKYKVIGVMSARGSSFGVDQDNTVVIPLSAAQRQFGAENINAIYISANTPESVKAVQAKAIEVLKKRVSEDDFTIQTQEQTLTTIGQITSVLTAALGGIAAISLLVGGIGIMNIMLVSVTERTREIGLRKALGAKPSDIRNQFLIEAVTLSGLGGIIGIILGVGLSLIINKFFTTTVPIWSIGLSFGFSMLVGVIFGVAPAIRAAKLDPIQALRYE